MLDYGSLLRKATGKTVVVVIAFLNLADETGNADRSNWLLAAERDLGVSEIDPEFVDARVMDLRAAVAKTKAGEITLLTEEPNREVKRPAYCVRPEANSAKLRARQ
jgi:hypothetical protein